MRKTEDIVCYDFQGWPEYKMNLRGWVVSRMAISSSFHPMPHLWRILVDDGMGYGVDENVIVSVDINSQNEYINIFRECKPSDEDQAELARQN